jgi:hypothetical protein
MTDDETAQVVVVLGDGPVPVGAFNTEPTIVVPLDTTCSVQAQLTGGGFDITPSGWQPQSFINSSRVEWTWQVTPDKAGKLMLSLSVQSVFMEAGEEFDSAVGNYNAAISVAANPLSPSEEANSVLENPLFLTVFGVVLAAVLAGATKLVSDLRKKRRGEKPESNKGVKRGWGKGRSRAQRPH